MERCTGESGESGESVHSCVFFKASNRVHLNTHVENYVRKGKGDPKKCAVGEGNLVRRRRGQAAEGGRMAAFRAMKDF